MTTRLDRLLLLLSTGSTPLVRQTAAQQLGGIAAQRIARSASSSSAASVLAAAATATATASPGIASEKPTTAGVYHGLDGEWQEIVTLLVKLIPYLRSKSWETRAAAGLAVEAIVKAVGVWLPPAEAGNDTDATQTPLGVSQPSATALESFDLVSLLLERPKLLSSTGNEYVGTSAEGGKNAMVKSLGLSMPGAGDSDLGIDVEKELMAGEQQQQQQQHAQSSTHLLQPDAKGKRKASASPSPASSPGPSIEEDDTKHLSARERIALKRRRKAAGAAAAASPAPVAPPSHTSKVRIIDSASASSSALGSRTASPAPVAVKKEEEDVTETSVNGDAAASEAVNVAYRGGSGNASSKIEVKEDETGQENDGSSPWAPTPDQWPFKHFCASLQSDLLHPAWEVRHGAALGLRELLKVQGRGGGMVAGTSAAECRQGHRTWCEDMASSLLQVVALDRFGDYLGDHVVAPVRETASQTLSALLLFTPDESVIIIHGILLQMIWQDTERQRAAAQPGKRAHSWEVRHAGLLGLKYLVAVRKDLFAVQANEGYITESSIYSVVQGPNLLKDALDVAILGLRDTDDDVRGVAASALLPILPELVHGLPSEDFLELLDVIYLCLSDLKDDLSSSVGNVMDLLAGLIRFPLVLELLQESKKGRSLAELVPRLYPFFRHSISSVRFAVVGALNIFLSLPTSDARAWIDGRLLRLVYQNLIVEERVDTCLATQAAWSTILRHLVHGDNTLQELARPHLAGWLDILMTPVGQAVNTGYFWKPSDYDSNSSGAYDVDKPLLLQDLALVSVEQTLRGRLAATLALAQLLSAWSVNQHEGDFGHLLYAYLTSASSHQISFVSILLEEWARASAGSSALATSASAVSSPVVARLAPIVVKALEGETAASYSETSALLSQIFAHCQQLFGIFKTKGKIAAGKIPTLAGPSGHGFSLERAAQAAGSDYSALEILLKPQNQAAARPLLEELRNKIRVEIARASAIKESMDVEVFASLAGAAVVLRTLPGKMNPLIRSIMNGVKFEANPDLQSRAARTIASFIDLCTSPDTPVKANPTDKVVKNICTFLCQDTTITPLFAAHRNAAQGILTLETPIASPNGSAKKSGPGAPVEAGESEDVIKARLVRRGAEMAMQSLADQFGDHLFVRVPKLWSCMSQTLLELFRSGNIAQADALCDSDANVGQDLLDCLTVLAAATPTLPVALRSQIVQLLPQLVLAVQSSFAVIRFVAARCMATVCNTVVEEGLKTVIMDVLPYIGDPISAPRRRGAVEVIACLVQRLDIRILPYIVFLIVPILGRMTDPDDEVRMLATSTFATLVKLVPLEAGLPDPPGFSEEMLSKRTHERAFLVQLLDGSKVAEYEMPISVSVDLRKYQREGISWLAFLAKYQLHGILCDDMGLGKTLQSICILASKIHERAERFKDTRSPDAVHLPSLVVCPPTLTGHWEHEIRTYAPNLRATIYGGDRSERLKRSLNLGSYDVVILSYDVVRNDIDALSRVEWMYCILDEGHIIKNAKTKLSKAIKMIRANHRLILSGTPIQNNVLELWSLFDFLMPGFLGTEESFSRRFGKPIQQSRDAKSSSKEQEAGALALEALHKQVLPFLLRRLKEDVLDDLPPKIIQDYYCDLSPLQQDLYESYSRAGASGGGNADDVAAAASAKDTHVFRTLQYLKRLVNHPTLVLQADNEEHHRILQLHSVTGGAEGMVKDIAQAPKLMALKQLLLDSGIGSSSPSTQGSAKAEAELHESAVAPHRVLIFCQMKTMLDLIEDTLFRVHLPSVTYMRMDGATPSHKRHAVVQTFNADPSIDVLLLTTHVGGLGLNLTGADTVIFVEHDWNPMKDLQAMDRAHRLGQKRVVNVYRLITRGTLEEKIMGLQRFKLNIASTVVSQQNADIGTMETENVLDLFSLGSKKDDEDAAAAVRSKAKNGPISQKELLDGLAELGDQDGEYDGFAADANAFAASLKS